MENKDYRQNITVQYCFPYINSSCRKEVRTGPAYILLFIVLSCVSVFTVFLNLLVIISISHFKQLHTPTNLLILSLAVADLLVGLFVMPVNIMQLIDSCWYLGQIACTVSLVVSFVSASGSLCSLVLIAVDRYIAVTDPLLYSMKFTDCKTILFIIVSWSFVLLYILICIYSNDHLLPSQIITTCYGECVIYVKYSWVIADIVICFVAPCSVILLLYSIIFKVARRQAKAVRAVTNGPSNKHGAQSLNVSETKATKTLSIIIFVYLVCYIPYYLGSLTDKNLTSSSMVWTVLGWLVFMNSFLNPLIYAIFYPWFRASVKYVLTCKRVFFSPALPIAWKTMDASPETCASFLDSLSLPLISFFLSHPPPHLSRRVGPAEPTLDGVKPGGCVGAAGSLSTSKTSVITMTWRCWSEYMGGYVLAG
ncbi:trace amine-associated receptor 13c-like [Colossoma macropomum]|uniref:trace amine-associated receptor 13c-like n=1 Tax=Colossoma macropomum TaxID=42526 RepID=UPI0018648E77|nr:trace amine-associated receptor 13c-like [Colossoma macropomum]